MANINPLNLKIEVAEPTTCMAQAIFNELTERLQLLADHGKQHIIDLTSLPLTHTDKKELESMLGQGEVKMTLSSMGESQIIETAYSGIWWIKHFTADEKLISELIEITHIPEIIKSHPDDIKLAASNMKTVSKNEQGEQV